MRAAAANGIYWPRARQIYRQEMITYYDGFYFALGKTRFWGHTAFFVYMYLY